LALDRQPPDPSAERWHPWREARPLFGPPGSRVALAAFSFGATSAVYLSFAADHVEAAGGLAGLPGGAAGAAIFLSFGVGGLCGLAAGEAERRFGIAPLMVAVFAASAASLALLALAPSIWAPVVASAALQGACLMSISAAFSLSTLRLFPDAPSRGFCTLLIVFALGNVVATAAAGVAADRLGLAPTFWGAAALSLATAAGLSLRPARVAAEG